MEVKTIPAEVTPTFKMDEMNMRKLFVTSVYKYTDFRNSRALEELKKIDFCKNNFSDLTLVNYLRHVRNYVKYGTKEKNCPSYVYDIVDDLVARKYAKLRPSEQDKLTGKGRPHKCSTAEPVKIKVQPTKVPVAVPTQQITQSKVDTDPRQAAITFMQAEVDRLMDQKVAQEKQLTQITTQIETFKSSIEMLKI